MMSRDPISHELRGLDSWLTRETWEDEPTTAESDLLNYLDDLQQEGRLVPIDEAPKDGTEFKAVLADTGETVTTFYSRDHRYWLGEHRWQDANGDGAPDGHCRVWHSEDFAGMLIDPTEYERAA